MNIFPRNFQTFQIELRTKSCEKLEEKNSQIFLKIRNLSKEIWQRLMARMTFLLSTEEKSRVFAPGNPSRRRGVRPNCVGGTENGIKTRARAQHLRFTHRHIIG